MSESDADKIRNKRLAKLGGGASNSSPTQSDKNPASTDASPSGSKPASPKPSPGITSTTSSSNPFSQLGVGSNPQQPPRVNISGGSTGQKREGDGTPRPRKPAGEESNDVWEHRQLSQIFRVTLDAENKTDAHGKSLYHLEGLKGDLTDENAPLLLKTSHLDQALTEAGTKAAGSGEDPLDYLLSCWKRVGRTMRNMKLGDGENPRYETMKEVRRLCMSYCCFAVSMPEMFDASPKADNPLVKHLLAGSDSETGIDPEFLLEASGRFDDDDTIKETLIAAVEQLSRQLSKLDMNGDYKPYVTAMRTVVRYPKIVAAISESPNFIPEGITAQNIEIQSTLGPFFRISPVQPNVASNYFSAPRTRDRGFIANAQKALRMTLQTHQAELFDIANAIIKCGKDPREKMLDWFALTVNANHMRRAMRPDAKVLSTDGFMINVTAILDQLCDPFMDATFSKVDRIDVDYLRRKPRINIKDETKINADEKISDEFYSHTKDGSNNFISEIFFLTVAAHHYGTEAANSQLETKKRELKYLEKDLQAMEAERQRFLNQPNYLRIFDIRAQKFKDHVDNTHSIIHATQGVLLDELVQARSMQFMRYVIVWLLRIASGKNLPKEQLTLPFPDQPTDVFKCLPQYIVDDIAENFKFITRNMPWIVTSTQCEEIVNFCIAFLRSPEYVKSPYCKSSLVSILCYGVFPQSNNSKGILGDLLNGSTFCHKHLLHALMQFYIECENTGAHNAFYDKFNIRYEIDTVIKCIWPNPIYREILAQEARTNTDFFVHFVNLLLNDVTYVLDESFNSFIKIHELTKELAHPENLDETIRKEKTEHLEDQKGRAKSYMGLTTETISMLKLFTEALATSFTMPEIVQRLADMLDYNVDALVGPKRRNLVVEAPEQYGFNPKLLLSDLFDVYLNLGKKEPFRLAVARDGRSYKHSNFQETIRLMQTYGLKSKEEIETFSKLADDIAAVHAADQQSEEDLGEIPDELLDPIMGSLMLDPVLLPSSKQIVDRSTIRSHLLSDPTDPFNRVPLKMEDVVPATEKKKEIEDFIAAKKAEKMDTSSG